MKKESYVILSIMSSLIMGVSLIACGILISQDNHFLFFVYGIMGVLGAFTNDYVVYKYYQKVFA